jgi:hypothetical protein
VRSSHWPAGTGSGKSNYWSIGTEPHKTGGYNVWHVISLSTGYKVISKEKGMGSGPTGVRSGVHLTRQQLQGHGGQLTGAKGTYRATKDSSLVNRY